MSLLFFLGSLSNQVKINDKYKILQKLFLITLGFYLD